MENKDNQLTKKISNISNFIEVLDFKKIDIPQKEEFDVFKKKISKLIGLDLFNYKNTQLERRITFLMNRNNIFKLEEYFKVLESNSDKLNEFTNMLTINVTEFFRNEEKFLELEKKIIPQLVKNFGNSLKIWSAGCSCGAEIYSIAMILDTMKILDKCRLVASDFDKDILTRAKKGIYSKFEVSLQILEKHKDYFSYIEKEDNYQIIPKITSKVDFRREDILNSIFEKDFHLILCRNVVIYFTEDAKEKLYLKFYNSLCNGGVLFIGSTERVNNYRELGFSLTSLFFYQK